MSTKIFRWSALSNLPNLLRQEYYWRELGIKLDCFFDDFNVVKPSLTSELKFIPNHSDRGCQPLLDLRLSRETVLFLPSGS